jgi:hypothetical protein
MLSVRQRGVFWTKFNSKQAWFIDTPLHRREPIFLDATYAFSITNSTALIHLIEQWHAPCTGDYERKTTDSWLIRLSDFFTSLDTSRFVTLGSRGRYICYTPGRGPSWTGCRYHLVWNVGTMTSSPVSWTF